MRGKREEGNGAHAPRQGGNKPPHAQGPGGDTIKESSFQTEIARLREVFDRIPVAAFEFDRDLRLLRMNAAGAEAIGENAEDAIGRRLGSARNPWLGDSGEHAMRSGRPKACLQEFRTPVTGELKRLIVTYLPDVDQPPDRQRLFIEAVDVTGLVDAKSGAGIERAQFEALVQQLLGGIVVLAAPDGSVLFANARARELLGIEVGDRPSALNRVQTCEGQELPALPVVRALEGEVVRGEEVEVCTTRELPQRMVVSAAPVFGRTGRIVAALGLLVDVTTRRRREQELEATKTAFASRTAEEREAFRREVQGRVATLIAREQEVLAAVLEETGLGAVTVDTDGIIIRANRVLERLLGYQPDGLRGVRYDDLLFIDDIEEEHAHYRELAEGRASGYVIDQCFVRKDGSIVWTRMRAALVHGQAPDARVEVIRLIEDRTEEVRVQERLEDSERALRRTYSDVISAMTGDRLVLVTAKELSQRLGVLLDGPFELQSPQELSDVRHQLQRAIAADMPDVRDPDGLVLAAAEAMANALKHTGSGRVELRRAGERDQVVISDSGQGIEFGSLPRATLTPGYSTLASSLGMGFTLMLETCDDVLLLTGPEGTTVALEMRADSEGRD